MLKILNFPSVFREWPELMMNTDKELYELRRGNKINIAALLIVF